MSLEYYFAIKLKFAMKRKTEAISVSIVELLVHFFGLKGTQFKSWQKKFDLFHI
jgi:hypothetical protein